MLENFPIYISALTSTLTILGFLWSKFREISKRLEYIDQIPILSEKVEKLERDVQEAIGVRKHLSDILKRLDLLEHLVTQVPMEMPK